LRESRVIALTEAVDSLLVLTDSLIEAPPASVAFPAPESGLAASALPPKCATLPQVDFLAEAPDSTLLLTDSVAEAVASVILLTDSVAESPDSMIESPDSVTM